MPKPQQERVQSALLKAKEAEIALDPATQKMWEGLSEEDRFDILQLPKLDRKLAIQDRHGVIQRALRAMPQLEGLQEAGQELESEGQRQRYIEGMEPGPGAAVMAGPRGLVPLSSRPSVRGSLLKPGQVRADIRAGEETDLLLESQIQEAQRLKSEQVGQ